MAYIKFTAGGMGLCAFRDALRDNGIRCAFQQMRGGVFYAQTAARNLRRLKALAAENGVTLQITRTHGLRFLLRPYRLRFGIPAGMLFAAFFFVWNNSAVRKIEINGNQRVSEDEIRLALAGLGVTEGTPFREIPYTYVEQKMRLAVHDIEWIALRHTGGRLIVDMTEERNPPEMTQDRIPANIIAAHTAQITDMSVLGGTAVKQRGEVVKKGEMLISGVRTDKFGITRYERAAGTVRGIYQETFMQEQPFVTELPVQNTESEQTLLKCFGKQFSLTLGFTPPAPAGDLFTEDTEHPLILFGHTLPFAVIGRKYIRRTTAMNVWSEEEARAILEENAARWIENFHTNDTILGREPEFCVTNLGIMLKINYTFEGVIGEEIEFFVKLP